MSQESQYRTWRVWGRRLCNATLLGFILFFAFRRSPPTLQQWFFCDFANFYSGSRAWLVADGDPYQLDQVYRAWHDSGHGKWLSIPNLEAQDIWAAVYPPSSLAMLAPLAAMPAFPAHVLWLALNLALFVAACAAVWSLGDIQGWEQKLFVALLIFASSVGISTFASGQLALAAGSLVIISVWTFRRHYLVVAGLLIGVAASIKIQVGIPFILYFLLLRKWRTALSAILIFGTTTVIGVAPLESRGIHWFPELIQNARQTLEPGGINDSAPGAPYRNDMVNLQTLLDVVTRHSRAADMISVALVVLGAAWVGVLVHYAPHPERNLPLLSMVVVLGVLPVYHRLYDTLPLALLMAWAIRRLRTPLRGFAIATLVILAEFLIPIDLVPTLVRWTHLPDRLTHSLVWQGIIVPHHAWGLLLLTVWLMYMCTAIEFHKPRFFAHSHRLSIPPRS